MRVPTTEQTLPLDVINEPPHQLRSSIDPTKLGRLADDIAARGGLLQRIGVRDDGDGRYTIGFGHRRYLAHKLLGWPAIEARVWPASVDLLDIAIAENEFQEKLNPMEDARAMHQLAERGEPLAHIARRYRTTEATVRGRLALLDLPADLQEAIEQGRLALVVAVALADVDHDEYRASLIAEAQRTGASARVVAVWTAAYNADRDRFIANHSTVAEIVQHREQFIVYVPCDACHVDTPYTATEARRFCKDCLGELTRALAEAQLPAPG
jgi:ParB/RepB/Spo0J family partition protein